MDIIFPFTYSIIFVILLNISFRKKIKGIRIIDWLLSRRKVVLSILIFLLVVLFFVFARNYLIQLAELIILGIIFLMSTIVLNSLIQNSHGFEPFTEEKSEWIRRKIGVRPSFLAEQTVKGKVRGAYKLPWNLHVKILILLIIVLCYLSFYDRQNNHPVIRLLNHVNILLQKLFY